MLCSVGSWLFVRRISAACALDARQSLPRKLLYQPVAEVSD